MRWILGWVACGWLAFGQAGDAGDWRAFRGSDGRATSTDAAPLTWSDDENLVWRVPLPGPGTSSPIVVGDRVFVTCWSGYGLDMKEPGEPRELRRHLLCLDKRTGRERWRATVRPVATEDTFDGRMSGHGYASSTPVSDGERVYGFFGKSGVFAWDVAGRLLWRRDVGRGSSQWKTGSGSSPALWRDLLFVNASDESHAVWALDKHTGEEVWKRHTEKLDQAYGTPVVVDRPEGSVLLLAILGEIWGLAPRTGELKWFARTRSQGALVPTIQVEGDVLYSLGGRTQLQSYAVRLGGKGDVTDSHIVWSSRYGAYVGTPVLRQGHLYWFDRRGVAYCAAAKTGDLVFRERVEGMFYASPIVVGDRIYAVSRDEGTFVLAARPQFRMLAHNRFTKDASQFDGTPAVSEGRLYVRSRRALYCVGRPFSDRD